MWSNWINLNTTSAICFLEGKNFFYSDKNCILRVDGHLPGNGSICRASDFFSENDVFEYAVNIIFFRIHDGIIIDAIRHFIHMKERCAFGDLDRKSVV